MKLTDNQTLQYATTLHQEGKFEGAEQLYRSLLKTQPTNLKANNNLGVLLFNVGRLDESEGYFKKAIEFNPTYAGTNFNLGNTLYSLGKFDEAELSYKREIDLNPSYAESYFNLGNLLKDLKRFDEAIINYKKAIELKPDFVNARCNLGYVYSILKKNDEAIEEYIKALEIDPKHAKSQDNFIFLLDYFLPSKSTHPLIDISNNLKKIENNFTLEEGIKDFDLSTLFKKSNKIIKDNVGQLTFNHPQIYRKNSIDLGCTRHMGIFDKFNIIPKFCFSCFKIQIEPKNVLELCKLYLIFDQLKLPKNNTRKCMVEMRPEISGTYKGLIYCSSMEEINEILKLITPIIDKIIIAKIKIKRGCSEYSEAFSNYGVTNKEDKNYMKYNDLWDEKEKIFDSTNLKPDVNDNVTFCGNLTISDILIMNNWLNYAKKINDLSYKDISEDMIHSDFIYKIMSNQLDIRKKKH